MGSYNPKISISSAPGVTGYLYMVLYEATAPNVPVANSGQIPPPHSSSYQIQFTGLNPVVHLGKLFETNGISTTGTVLSNFSLDPSFASFEIKADKFIYGGVDDGFDVGDNKYVSPTDELEGWDYSLEVQGQTLDPDAEYSTDAENNPIITDGTSIAGGGTYQIYDDEKWVFHFKPKLVSFSGDPVITRPYNVTEVITANRTLTVDDLGKNFIVASATSTITITLPAISAITEMRPMYFMSEGGSHKNVVFSRQGSDQISYLGNQTKIILGQGEALQVYLYDGKYRVQNDLVGVREVGQIFAAYEIVQPNTAFCNGQLLSRTIYARLWYYVSTKLDASLLVSDATWLDTAQHASYKFSTGDGSTTFRLPMLFDFIRGVNGSTRLAGSFQDSQNKKHNHIIPGDDSLISWNQNTALWNPVKADTTVRNGDLLSSTGSGHYLWYSSDNYYLNADTGLYTKENIDGDNEGHPINTGAYMLIKI